MENKEALQMMERCASELATQRKRIEELQPKADAYDNISIILGLLPRPTRGYGEDLVWTLKKRMDELRQKMTEAPPPAVTDL